MVIRIHGMIYDCVVGVSAGHPYRVPHIHPTFERSVFLQQVGNFLLIGDHLRGLARQVRDYIESWIRGHFYNLDEIRSRDRVIDREASPRKMRFVRPTQPQLADGRKTPK